MVFAFRRARITNAVASCVVNTLGRVTQKQEHLTLLLGLWAKTTIFLPMLTYFSLIRFKISTSSGQAAFADVGFLPGVFGPVIIFDVRPIDSTASAKTLINTPLLRRFFYTNQKTYPKIALVDLGFKAGIGTQSVG